MTNEMVLERTSNLVMPSHYVELDSEEMSYVEGGLFGKIFSTICLAVVAVASVVGGIAALCGEKSTTNTIIGVCGIVVGVATAGTIVGLWVP